MKIAVIALAVLGLGSLALLVSDTRMLVSETKVEPGRSYVVEDYGDLGKNTQASLVCRYFTGRGFKTTVFWYAPGGFFGRDSCPFLHRP